MTAAAAFRPQVSQRRVAAADIMSGQAAVCVGAGFKDVLVRSEVEVSVMLNGVNGVS